jgi:hypothetical protein
MGSNKIIISLCVGLFLMRTRDLNHQRDMNTKYMATDEKLINNLTVKIKEKTSK